MHGLSGSCISDTFFTNIAFLVKEIFSIHDMSICMFIKYIIYLTGSNFIYVSFIFGVHIVIGGSVLRLVL